MSETAKKHSESTPEPSARDEKREEVVREVAADAVDRPEGYLRDAEVREGGE